MDKEALTLEEAARAATLAAPPLLSATVGGLAGYGAGEMVNKAYDERKLREFTDDEEFVQDRLSRNRKLLALAGAILGTKYGLGVTGKMLTDHSAKMFDKKGSDDKEAKKPGDRQLSEVDMDKLRKQQLETGEMLSMGEDIAGLAGGITGMAGGGYLGHQLNEDIGLIAGSLGGGILGSTVAVALARAINKRKNILAGPNFIGGVI